MSRRCGQRLHNSWVKGFETGLLVESEEEKREKEARKQEKLANAEATSIPLLNLAQLKDNLNDLNRVHEHLGFRFQLRDNLIAGTTELYLVKAEPKGPKELIEAEYEIVESPEATIKRLEKEVAEEKRKHMETISILETVMDIKKKFETENADLKNTVAWGDATVQKLYERIEELTGKWNNINKEFGKLTEKCAGLGLVDRSEPQA
ncbi:hypothetical protein CAEBREN_01078 [Caenorhabditis brenneri]|uniref:Uncharacterized protein n=1 Tax=Caenorhabditis brenneri TaxID=135651 RepID=G0N257_CAEBE|nr:hypothetical protein CAEBREN_01078 [Caenorhabditis brenneri]